MMSRLPRFLLAPLVVFASAWLLHAAPPAEPVTTRLGSRIDPLPIQDAQGKPVTLPADQPVVIVFLSFECPVSNAYAVTLNDLAREYGKRGVAFFGLCPVDLTAEEIAKHAREFHLNFPVYKDVKLAAADALKAEITPEAFVLDRNRFLRYRGRIDSSYYARLKKNAITATHDLRDALEDIVQNRPIKAPATLAIGCAIARDQPAPRADAQVTYHRDVAPILQTQCQGCHRAGEVGPFALTNYRQAVNWASDIKEYTQSRKMPPWKPCAGGPFAYERKMSDKDIATLARWVDEGMAEGDPAHAPPPPQFASGWQLGQPDLVLTVPADFTVGPSGSDLFRCFVLPTGLTEDRHVVAYEVRPGNPRVVHHTLNFIDTQGRAQALQDQQRQTDQDKKDLTDFGPGYSVRMGVGFLPRGGLGGWAPGQVPHELPEGLGFFLPKNSDIVLQVHYHRTGRVETDRTAIGLYFAKKPVQKNVQPLIVGLANPLEMLTFFIPPDQERVPVQRSLWVAEDCTLFSVMPHMHLLGRQVRVTMTPPDGPTRTLVDIKEWDYNWQETYYFATPIRVAAGTRFDIEAIYDNSRKNPNNPSDPPKLVRFGEQTTNEMCFGFLQVAKDKPGPITFYIDKEKKRLLPSGRRAPDAPAPNPAPRP